MLLKFTSEGRALDRIFQKRKLFIVGPIDREGGISAVRDPALRASIRKCN